MICCSVSDQLQDRRTYVLPLAETGRAERRQSPDLSARDSTARRPPPKHPVQRRVNEPWTISARTTLAPISEDLRPAARRDWASGATSVARSVLSPRRAAGRCGNFGLQIADCRLQIADCRLQIADLYTCVQSAIKNRQSQIQNRKHG